MEYNLYNLTIASFLMMGLNLMFGNGASMCGLPAGNGSKQFGLGLMAYAIAHHLVPSQDSQKRHGSLAFILFAFFMNGNFAKESKLVVLLLAVFNFMSGDYSKPVHELKDLQNNAHSTFSSTSHGHASSSST